MQMVIDIPEETYEEVTWRGLHLCPRDEYALVDAIKNGTPLPKGHKRIIDESKITTIYTYTEETMYNNLKHIRTVIAYTDAPTIIERDDS